MNLVTCNQLVHIKYSLLVPPSYKLPSSLLLQSELIFLTEYLPVFPYTSSYYFSQLVSQFHIFDGLTVLAYNIEAAARFRGIH